MKFHDIVISGEKMPEIGEIRTGKQLGFKDGHRHIWHACQKCGKQRWVSLHKGKPESIHCKSCSMKGRILSEETKHKIANSNRGEHSPNWKGGRIIRNGYIEIKLQPDDFFYPMAHSKGYVHEHRLVMAKHLKRRLLSWEIIHHKNGIRSDNRLENLRLLPGQIYHVSDSQLKQRVNQLEKRVTLLESENILLKEELKLYHEIL